MRLLSVDNFIFFGLVIISSCSEQAYNLIPINTATLAVDPVCSQSGPKETQALAKWAPLPPAVPQSCLVGFEINNKQNPPIDELNPLILESLNPLGSQERVLELDYATYVAPNSLEITGTTLDGTVYSLFNSCVLKTWLLVNPTASQRPCEDSIRDFRLNLRSGTKSIVFKPESKTPYYVRILGLCDFDLSIIPPSAISNNQTLRYSNDRDISPLEGTLNGSGVEVCPASAKIL